MKIDRPISEKKSNTENIDVPKSGMTFQNYIWNIKLKLHYFFLIPRPGWCHRMFYRNEKCCENNCLSKSETVVGAKK